jgi:predicted dehydrogenase
MDSVRVGVIGVGGMGSSHTRLIQELDGMELCAVCDIVPGRMEGYACAKFEDSRELIRSGLVDAVTIATPHYDHTTIAIDALNNGLHVLTEKPIAVHQNDAQKMIDAHTDKSLVFSAMFNQRTDSRYQKIRDLVSKGELGEIRRVTWIITSWFRTQAYYDSGGWRATWKGEGGGVLVNQCPHNLDLLQWMTGMPSRVTAVIGLGKYHDIEVEDDVNAVLEYPNGATGNFITSTGEAPGTNRLEIAGDQGRLVMEGDSLVFTRNEVPMDVFCRENDGRFSSPPAWTCQIPTRGHGDQHRGIMVNFRDAILRGAELLAPAEEGIRGVQLANAMIMSGITGKPVDIPLDGDAYESMLQRLIAESSGKKAAAEPEGDLSLSGSFSG